MNFKNNIVKTVQEKINSSNGITMPSLIGEMEKEGISSLDTGIAVDFLIKESLIKESSQGMFVSINGIVGDNMNEKRQLTQEQKDFRTLVCNNKGKIYDAQKDAPFLTHRGIEIAFGGCGEKAFRYIIALDLGLSDLEPVERIPRYLDWNDPALYDEGGIADQIKELLGTPLAQKDSEVSLRPVKINIGGK